VKKTTYWWNSLFKQCMC